MELDSCYTHITADNFEDIFSQLFKDAENDGISRFKSVLTALNEKKNELVELDRKRTDQIAAYPVPDGLCACCISCVENWVLPTLSEFGFETEFILRQFDSNFIKELRSFPQIHAYVVIKIADIPLIVDMDADPFIGQNTGIVVSPLLQNEIYSIGHIVHLRRINKNGEIIDYSFCYDTKEGPFTYIKGDCAAYITVKPFFREFDENWCPIVFEGGATLYFNYSRTWINMISEDTISAILAVKRSRDDKKEHSTHLYNLRFDDITMIGIIKSCEGESVIINVAARNGTYIFTISSNGRLLPGGSVKYYKVENHFQDKEILLLKPDENMFFTIPEC